MNWLVVVGHDFKKQNAIRTHVVEFCRELGKIDNVTLLSFATPDRFGPDINFDVIQVDPIDIRPHNLGYFLSSLKLLIFLIRRFTSDKPDIIYTRAVAFGAAPLIFARLMKIMNAIEVNGAWNYEHKLSLESYNVWKRLYVAPILYIRELTLDFSIHLADKLITVTPNLSIFLQSKSIPPEKIFVVPNGVNIQHFTPMEKEKCKSLLGLNTHTSYIGYIGSLSAWQGVDLLIKSFDSVINNQPKPTQINLLIVGTGQNWEKLNRLSSERGLEDLIIFAGEKQHSQIPFYMGACDILISAKALLKSGYSPLKIYEYMACGRPVVASAVDGLEFITSSGSGVLFEPGNISDLATKIEELLTQPEIESIEMGQRARQTVVYNYSWENTVRQVRNILLT